MRRMAEYGIALMLTVAWLLVKAPTPEFFLIGADGGHQLLGAMQILQAGEHPYIDFLETYGPLTFYASALGQYLSHLRPIGETALIAGGFTTGYLLLFFLARQIVRSMAGGYLLLVCALLLLPQFYKYYCVLLPMLSLAGAYCYLRFPGRRWPVALLALSAAVSFLFRHDFGVFSIVMTVALLAVDCEVPLHRRVARLGVFSCFFLLFLAPWLLFLAAHGALLRYLRIIAYASFSMSKGLALPHPLLHWSSPLLSLAFLLFFALPCLCLVLFFRKKGGFSTAQRKGLFAAAALAAASLAQSSHRADYYHLLEGAPAGFICLAFLIRAAEEKWQKGRVWPALTAVCVVAGLVAAASPARFLPGRGRLDVARKLEWYRLDRVEYIDRLLARNPAFWPAAAVRQVRENTPPGSRIAFYPFHMKFNYFADRPFAAGLMLLAPGYFDAPRYQARAAATLARQNVPFVLWNERFTFDNMPERNPVQVFSVLHEAVNREYSRQGMLYGFTVYQRNSP